MHAIVTKEKNRVKQQRRLSHFSSPNEMAMAAVGTGLSTSLTPLDGTTYTHCLRHHTLACLHAHYPPPGMLCLHACVHVIVPAFLCPCCVCTFALHNTCHVCVLTCAAVCSCWFIHHNTIKPIRPHTVSQSHTQSHTDHTFTHILSLSLALQHPYTSILISDLRCFFHTLIERASSLHDCLRVWGET